MKSQIGTNEFKNMLKVMDKIKPRELNCFLDLIVQSIDDRTKFIKTNNETTIVYTIRNYIEENGTLALPLDSAGLIKKLKENSFTLTEGKIKTDKKEISFTEQNNVSINTYDNIDKIFSITQKELLRMLEVSYAVAQDEIRPVLAGVCFDKNNTCSLDGYRMSVRVSNEYSNDCTFVVNKNSIEILKSILKDNDNIVNVYHDMKDVVKFEIDNIVIIAKCIEGEFIKYNSIIPEEYRNKVTIKPEELKEELEFMKSVDKRNYVENIIAEDKLVLKCSQCKEKYNEDESYKELDRRQRELDSNYKVKHDKWIKNGKKAREPQRKIAKFRKVYDLVPTNDIKSELKIESKLYKFDLDNGKFKIAYNPVYMLDAMKLYNDKVELRMTNKVSPIVVTNDGYNVELVLPVRIRN